MNKYKVIEILQRISFGDVVLTEEMEAIKEAVSLLENIGKDTF